MPNCDMHDPILEVVTGCMFSGKTEEVIRRVRRLQYASSRADWTTSYLAVIPKMKGRGKRSIQKALPGVIKVARARPEDILSILTPTHRIVVVDEAQFFAPCLVEVVQNLVRAKHRRVIVSGLNLDYLGRPWETMAPIICAAEDLHLCYAVCARCDKNRAVRSQRLDASRELVYANNSERYEARCLRCFEPPIV
jgi:thymidine kinase